MHEKRVQVVDIAADFEEIGMYRAESVVRVEKDISEGRKQRNESQLNLRMAAVHSGVEESGNPIPLREYIGRPDVTVE